MSKANLKSTNVRHMVALRDIKAGETIMEDVPLTYGPLCSSGIKPMCLGCYRAVDGSITCEICGWPMCSIKCSNRPQHRDQECQLFKDKGFRLDASKLNYKEPEPAYSCVSPLRALLLKHSDPDRLAGDYSENISKVNKLVLQMVYDLESDVPQRGKAKRGLLDREA